MPLTGLDGFGCQPLRVLRPPASCVRCLDLTSTAIAELSETDIFASFAHVRGRPTTQAHVCYDDHHER